MPRLKKSQILNTELKVIDVAKTGDLLPGESSQWKHIIPRLHKISQAFGYQRVETSPVEKYNFFPRWKDFIDLDMESLVRIDTASSKKIVLRSQNFLSVLRAYVENDIDKRERTTRWYYLGPTFSADEKALSHVYEFGMVNFGEPSAVSDAQMINMIRAFLEDLGVSNVLFEVNSKGCSNCDSNYHEVLGSFLNQNKAELCSDCQQNLAKLQSKQAPEGEDYYKVFLCRNSECKVIANSAPQIIDHIDDPCNKHLTNLLESLDELEVSYMLNPRLFDTQKLSNTIFRVTAKSETQEGEPQDIEFGIGGRLSRFVSKLTDQEIPTLTFQANLNSILDFVERTGANHKSLKTADVFVINIGEMASKKSLKLFWDLWKNNFRVAENFGENGIKNQFKLAETKGCTLALVIGQKEAVEGTVILRDVKSGMQEVFPIERITDEIRKRLVDD